MTQRGMVILLIVVVTCGVIVPAAGLADCVRYQDYFRWIGGTDTPGRANGVAISGTHAFVADGVAGLQVMDISQPEAPVLLGSVDTPGAAMRVVLSGDRAYVADADSGLAIVDISNPSSPVLVSRLPLGSYAEDVAVSGTYAYVAAHSGLQVIDVSNPSNPTLVGSRNSFAAAVAVSGSLAYVADYVANAIQFEVLDVSNPASPAVLGSVSTCSIGNTVVISGAYAYMTSQCGLEIIDVSNPTSPVEVNIVAAGQGSTAVDVVGSLAFVTKGSHLLIVDLSNPLSAPVGDIIPLGPALGVTVSNGYAYVASDYLGLQVFSVNQPRSPEIIGRIFDMTFVPTSVAASGAYAYMLSSKLDVVDVSNPTFPHVVRTVATAGQDIAIQGVYAYVIGEGAFFVIDISNPLSPAVVGTLYSSSLIGNGVAVAVSGSFAYVIDWYAGLYRINVSNPTAPAITGHVSIPFHSSDVAIWGSHAYVANQENGLRVIDLGTLSIVGTVDTPNLAQSVAANGSYAYIANSEEGLLVIDVSQPASPAIVGQAKTPGYAKEVALSGSFVYVADDPSLDVVSISNPTDPERVGEVAVQARHVVVSSFLYVTGANGDGFLVYPNQCINTPPSIQNPGTQNGTELAYLSVKINATDPDQDNVNMSVLGSLPNWVSFSDVGNGIAWVRGTPTMGQAGTNPVSIRASDGMDADTVAFNIVIAPAEGVVELNASGFIPGALTIPVGGQVTWVKNAGGNHTTTNGTGPLDPAAGSLWDAQLRATSPQFVRVFSIPGTYPYFCRNHPSEKGTITVSSARVGIGDEPTVRFRLASSPNPFATVVDVQFELDHFDHVTLMVMDVQGRKVLDLLGADLPAGSHRVTWNGDDAHHQVLGSGIYFVRLVIGDGRSLVHKIFKLR